MSFLLFSLDVQRSLTSIPLCGRDGTAFNRHLSFARTAFLASCQSFSYRSLATNVQFIKMYNRTVTVTDLNRLHCNSLHDVRMLLTMQSITCVSSIQFLAILLACLFDEFIQPSLYIIGIFCRRFCFQVSCLLLRLLLLGFFLYHRYILMLLLFIKFQ